jgi:hypothetical protein
MLKSRTFIGGFFLQGFRLEVVLEHIEERCQKISKQLFRIGRTQCILIVKCRALVVECKAKFSKECIFEIS